MSDKESNNQVNSEAPASESMQNLGLGKPEASAGVRAAAALGGDCGGVIVARGTGDGLVIRIDGRIGESSLLQALRDFVQARRTFLENNQVSLEWIGQRPAAQLEEQSLRMLSEDFSVHVRQSTLLREGLFLSADEDLGMSDLQPGSGPQGAAALFAGSSPKGNLRKSFGLAEAEVSKSSGSSERKQPASAQALGVKSKVTPFPLRRSRDAQQRDGLLPESASSSDVGAQARGGLPDAADDFSDEFEVGGFGSPELHDSASRHSETVSSGRASSLFDGLGAIVAGGEQSARGGLSHSGREPTRESIGSRSARVRGKVASGSEIAETRVDADADCPVNEQAVGDYRQVVAAALGGSVRAETVDRSTLGIDAAAWDDPDARIVFSTLRSGQKLESEHSLVIFGDVNSGAEVVAGGDIVVLGILRGVAHAGAYDESGGGRIIYAQNLQPTQLRIGTVISRGSADFARSEGSGAVAEVARVEGSLIVVEPYLSRTNALRAPQASRLRGSSGGANGRRGTA